jgi:signal transduction histidine kinase
VLFVPGDVADQIPTEHMVTAASGRQDMSERWLLRKDGSRFWARFTLVALEEASRAGYGVVLRDVTMQYRTEQELQTNRQQAAAAEVRIRELQEVVRQLEAFSYSISHDIRAPLRSVRGFADAVVQEYGEALKGDGIVYLNRIRLATDRLEKMVADILAFSRVAPTELKLEAVDLNRLVRALIEETLSVHAPHARVGIQGSLPTVMGHGPSLQQVFFNLVSNAIKFVAPGQRPEVTIRAETMSAEAVVWIEDNGIGIRAEDQTRIFEAFERIESVPPFPGTGVGLSIVRRTVERMGGTVGVTSNLGVGSRFWVKLRGLPPQP